MAQTFAGLTDIPLHGIPVPAIGQLSDAQKLACLDAAAAEMNSHFRARYQLPFTSFGPEFTQKNVVLGKYLMLQLRGYNPAAEADKQVKAAADEVLKWCVDVRQQNVHPECVESGTLEGMQPLVSSKPQRGY